MAKIAGREGRLYVSSDGGTSYSLLGCVVDMSLSGAADELDATCHEDGQYRTWLQGRKDASLSIDMRWDEADAGQVIVRNAYFNDTGITVQFRMQETSGLLEHDDIAGIVTAWEPSSPNDDIADLTATIRLSGDFAPSAQP